MTDPTKEKVTPKSTPRRTLGIRRTMPKSAPYTVPLTKKTIRIESASNADPSTSSDQSAAADRYSTPINKHRSKLTLSEGRKISKKLDLSNSPEKQSKKLPVEPLKSVENTIAAKTVDEQIEEVENEIRIKSQQIQDIEEYETDMNQLRVTVATWKAGAVKALKVLKEQVNPEQSVESILEHFKIPLDMFDISSIE